MLLPHMGVVTCHEFCPNTPTQWVRGILAQNNCDCRFLAMNVKHFVYKGSEDHSLGTTVLRE
jgi:hypothetical protein